MVCLPTDISDQLYFFSKIHIQFFFRIFVIMNNKDCYKSYLRARGVCEMSECLLCF